MKQAAFLSGVLASANTPHPTWEEALKAPAGSISFVETSSYGHHKHEARPHRQNRRQLRQEGGRKTGPLRIRVNREVTMEKRPEGTPRLWSRHPRRWQSLQSLHQRSKESDPKDRLHIAMKNYMEVMYTGTVKLGKSNNANDMVAVDKCVYDTGSDMGWVFGSRDKIDCCPSGMCVPEQQAVRGCDRKGCKQAGMPHNISNAFGPSTKDFTICYGKGFVSGMMTDSYLSLGDSNLPINFDVGMANLASSMSTDFQHCYGVFGFGPLTDNECKKNNGKHCNEPILVTLHKQHPNVVQRPMFSINLDAKASKFGPELILGDFESSLATPSCGGNSCCMKSTNARSEKQFQYWWTVPAKLSIDPANGAPGGHWNDNSLILDSGTTDMMVGTKVYDSLATSVAAWLGIKYDPMDMSSTHAFFKGYGEPCFQPPFNKMNMAKGPKLNVMIGGENYPIGPEQYIVKVAYKGFKFCLFGVSQIQELEPTLGILGDTWLRSYYTAYEYGSPNKVHIRTCPNGNHMYPRRNLKSNKAHLMTHGHNFKERAVTQSTSMDDIEEKEQALHHAHRRQQGHHRRP